MPWSPPKHCPRGHPAYTDRKGCPICRKAREAARPSAAARGYGTDWRKLRATLMPPGTPCRCCGKPASHLDHIKPKASGGTDDPSNLQPLCATCHSRKTDREDGGFGNLKGKWVRNF